MQSGATSGNKTFPSIILVDVSSDADNAIVEDIIKLVFAQASRETFHEPHVSWVPGYGDHGYFANLLGSFSSIYVDEVITDLYVDIGLKGILKTRLRSLCKTIGGSARARLRQRRYLKHNNKSSFSDN